MLSAGLVVVGLVAMILAAIVAGDGPVSVPTMIFGGALFVADAALAAGDQVTRAVNRLRPPER